MTAPSSDPAPLAPLDTHYPPARRADLVEDLHGHRVADPYRWLEDAQDDETRAWSRAQDELYARCRAQDEPADGPFATARLTARMRELLGAGFVGAPAWRGARRFFTRRAGDQEHAVLVLAEPSDDQPAGNAPGAREVERVLVDPVRLDPAGTTTLDAWQPSKEGDLLAYQVSTGGTEESVLHVLDVATGEVLDGPIDRARYSPVAWLPGGDAFYYVRRLAPELLPEDERQYHRRVWLHRVGTSTDEDVEVFGAGLAHTSYFGVSVSRDGRWLIVSASAGTAPRTDVWIADLTASAAHAPAFAEVAVGIDAETSAWVARDGRLYVHTDLDAPRGRLAVTDPAAPGVAHWRTLLPEDAEAVLEDVAFTDDGGEGREPRLLLASWRRHAVSEITVHDPASGSRLPGPAGTVALPGLGSVSGLVTRPEGGPEVWFGYTDHTSVATVRRFDATTREVTLWAAPPGAVADVPDVRVVRLEVASADGTTVRAFVVVRRDLVTEATGTVRPVAALPTVLYGYGGFQISLDPAYSAATLAWVEAGGAYVVANLRGGGEEGEQWHRDGMRGAKQNVFDDFHAVAQELVAQGWTTPDRLACWGGSNGGLLVGAAITQRPDLFAAAVCSAPLLDMVRYQRFGLGVTWTEEYGDADVPQELGWLLAYSPYHRVVEGTRYPATLFTVFEGDTRVDPLHARKLAAALQHATSAPLAERPVLVRRETGVGHGGRALSRTIGLTVEQLQFAARHTGLAGS